MSIGLLKEAGISVPAGMVANSSDEAYAVAKQIGKAEQGVNKQVHFHWPFVRQFQAMILTCLVNLFKQNCQHLHFSMGRLLHFFLFCVAVTGLLTQITFHSGKL